MHPNLFHLGPLTFHSYGFMVALGIFLASQFYARCASRVARTPDQMIDLVLLMTVAGFVSARILYVIYDFDFFITRPLEIFAIWNGGIIFYGGLIGAVAALLIYVRVFKLSALKILDLIVVGGALALAFGRIGCFLNGCCYGSETTCFLGVKFPFSEHLLHPTQLYESAYAFFLFVLLKLYYDKNYQAVGRTSFVYFTLQPLGRFTIETFRNDMPRLAFGFTLGQWMSIGLFAAACIAALIWGSRNARD